MQLISVERWTFWAGVGTAFFGPLLTLVLLPGLGFSVSNYSVDWVTVVIFIMIVSVALGGSRDPSIRRVPVQSDA